ncbi:MAG: peptide ABC transporter substrate-binding protein, partial [Firmicutes bacterium]|nr:peptide ABC transporter substrate-binding protein [Bacillota bacterium]
YIRGLTITAFESMGNADTAKLISANCEKAGIEMKPDMYEYNAWANKIEVEHSFAIELQGGFLGPDPSALGARVGTGGWASFGYSNARVDELLAAGVAEPDESKRKVYYDEIQEILVEELPYVCIAEYASVEGCASNLKNVPMDGAGKWGWAEWSKAYFE